MDLKQLRYFIAVAEQENFGRAAAILRIAQPALSRQIALLEAELGVPLFIRHTRGAVPTEAARLLRERARSILEALAQAKHDVVNVQAKPSGMATLGIHPSLAVRLSPPLIQACLTELPNVKLTLTEGYSQSMVEMVVNKRVDLAIVNAHMSNSMIEPLIYEPLLHEEICLIGRPEPLLKIKDPIELFELVSMPMILGRFRKGGLCEILRSMMADIGHQPKIIAEADSVVTAKKFIKDGHGYTVTLPVSVEDDIADGSLAARPIRGFLMQRVLVRSREHPQSRGAQELTRLIKQVVRKAVEGKSWPGASLALND